MHRCLLWQRKYCNEVTILHSRPNVNDRSMPAKCVFIQVLKWATTELAGHTGEQLPVGTAVEVDGDQVAAASNQFASSGQSGFKWEILLPLQRIA